MSYPLLSPIQKKLTIYYNKHCKYWLRYSIYLFVDLDQTVNPISMQNFSRYKLTSYILQHLQNLGFTVRYTNGLDDLKFGKVKEKEVFMEIRQKKKKVFMEN